jgi:hypothetical protein
VFIAYQITLQTSFPAARVRLAQLAGGEFLRRASQGAYAEGLAGPSPAGPVTAPAGGWRLTSVQLGEWGVQDVPARFPLRWEATGPGGERSQVLDADLTLAAAGENRTVLALTGVYRPPSGMTVAGSGQEVVRRCAADTIGGLLARLASAIRHPAGWAEPAHLAG